MQADPISLKKILSWGLVAAFGLITMSSNISANSYETVNSKQYSYYDLSCGNINETLVCSSPAFSSEAIGDVIFRGKTYRDRTKNVNLIISKISKYKPKFYFEDVYEEI